MAWAAVVAGRRWRWGRGCRQWQEGAGQQQVSAAQPVECGAVLVVSGLQAVKYGLVASAVAGTQAGMLDCCCLEQSSAEGSAPLYRTSWLHVSNFCKCKSSRQPMCFCSQRQGRQDRHQLGNLRRRSGLTWAAAFACFPVVFGRAGRWWWWRLGLRSLGRLRSLRCLRSLGRFRWLGRLRSLGRLWRCGAPAVKNTHHVSKLDIPSDH